MARMEVKIETLKDLAPEVVVLFEQSLRNAVKDCRDRPALGKARKVQLTAIIVPDTDDKGNMDGTRMSLQVVTKLPAQETVSYSLAATTDGRLAFNVDDPQTHHRQTTTGDFVEKTDESV